MNEDILTLTKDQCAVLEKIARILYGNRYTVIKVSPTHIDMQIFSNSIRNWFRLSELQRCSIKTERRIPILEFLIRKLPKELSNLQMMNAIGNMGEGTTPVHKAAISEKIGRDAIDEILEYTMKEIKNVLGDLEPIKYTNRQIHCMWQLKVEFPSETVVRYGDRYFKIQEITSK